MMRSRWRETGWLLLGAVVVVGGYLILREVAYATRAGEVILSPGRHARTIPVLVLLGCVGLRLLAVVAVPGLLAARLWWVWTRDATVL